MKLILKIDDENISIVAVDEQLGVCFQRKTSPDVALAATSVFARQIVSGKPVHTIIQDDRGKLPEPPISLPQADGFA